MLHSPFGFLVCDFIPALFADRKDFSFNLDVELNVLAFTVVFPRVFTMFHF